MNAHGGVDLGIGLGQSQCGPAGLQRCADANDRLDARLPATSRSRPGGRRRIADRRGGRECRS